MARITERFVAPTGTGKPIGIETASVHRAIAPKIINSPIEELDELSLAVLTSFFQILDQWDREANSPC
jgi:hypothetical protein